MPNPFTTEEDSIIKEFYGKIQIRRNPRRDSLQSRLWGRSEGQIKNRIKELNLEKSDLKYLNHYSQEEIIYLKENYAYASWKDLISKLGRKKENIMTKASSLKLKRSIPRERRGTWSVDEEEYLRDNYKIISDNIIEKKLNKSRSSVYNKAKRMGLGK